MTRIGNAERDAAIERLRSWYASGHLDDTDLDERITAALAARTDTELLKVAADLPVPVRRVVRVPHGANIAGGCVLMAASAIVAFAGPAYLLNSTHGHALGGLLSFLVAASMVTGVAGVVTSVIWMVWAAGNQEADKIIAGLKTDLQLAEERLTGERTAHAVTRRELTAATRNNDISRRNGR